MYICKWLTNIKILFFAINTSFHLFLFAKKEKRFVYIYSKQLTVSTDTRFIF